MPPAEKSFFYGWLLFLTKNVFSPLNGKCLERRSQATRLVSDAFLWKMQIDSDYQHSSEQSGKVYFRSWQTLERLFQIDSLSVTVQC